MAKLSFDALSFRDLAPEAQIAFHQQHARLLMEQACGEHGEHARVFVFEVAPRVFEFQTEGCCVPFLERLAGIDENLVV